MYIVSKNKKKKYLTKTAASRLIDEYAITLFTLLFRHHNN